MIKTSTALLADAVSFKDGIVFNKLSREEIARQARIKGKQSRERRKGSKGVGLARVWKQMACRDARLGERLGTKILFRHNGTLTIATVIVVTSTMALQKIS